MVILRVQGWPIGRRKGKNQYLREREPVPLRLDSLICGDANAEVRMRRCGGAEAEMQMRRCSF